MEARERSLAISMGLEFVPGMFSKISGKSRTMEERTKTVSECYERVSLYDIATQISMPKLQHFFHPYFQEAVEKLPSVYNPETAPVYKQFVQGTAIHAK